MNNKIAFLYKKYPVVPRTLIDSVIEILGEKYDVSVYNLINDHGLYSVKAIDDLYANRDNYKCIFVVDLGELKDYKIHRDFYKCPLVRLAVS